MSTHRWNGCFVLNIKPHISLTDKKTELRPKQRGLCSHCSPWPPTERPLEEHSPWNDQAISPPRLCRSTEICWAEHILPFFSEIIQFTEHTECRKTGGNQKPSCHTPTFSSQPRHTWWGNFNTCCTYWLLPAKRCGSLPLPGSCGLHKRRNLHLACSDVRGRCVERRGSRWAAACAANGDCPDPFPPVRHLCTTPQLGLADPPPYSWEWRVPPWKRSGQKGARQSGAVCPLGGDGILKTNDQDERLT